MGMHKEQSGFSIQLQKTSFDNRSINSAEDNSLQPNSSDKIS